MRVMEQLLSFALLIGVSVQRASAHAAIRSVVDSRQQL